MYFSAQDFNNHLHITRLVGAYVPQSHYDQTCRERLQQIETAKRVGAKAIFQLIIVGRECSSPNAQQRKQIAELDLHVGELRSTTLLITRSALIRGAQTAINWIRPQPRGTRLETFADTASALKWLHQHNPEIAPATAALVQRVDSAVEASLPTPLHGGETEQVFRDAATP
jgi:hypothetical protein